MRLVNLHIVPIFDLMLGNQVDVKSLADQIKRSDGGDGELRCAKTTRQS